MRLIKVFNIKTYWFVILPFCSIASSLFILSINNITISDPKSNKVVVLDKSYSTDSKSRSKTYYVKVTSWHGINRTESIKINSDLWDSIEINSKHIIKIKKGFFGLESLIAFY